MPGMGGMPVRARDSATLDGGSQLSNHAMMEYRQQAAVLNAAPVRATTS